MSTGFSPNWATPAKNRVLRALGERADFVSVHTLARLAGVAYSTALRVSSDLVDEGVLHRVRVSGRGRLLHVDHAAARRLRAEYVQPRTVAQELDHLRELDAPIWVITDADLHQRGVTRHVGTFVAVPATWRARVDRRLKVVVFKRARPLELARESLPDLELLVALLKIDRLAARQLFTKLSWNQPQRRRLLRRIRDENLRPAAQAARIPLDRRRA